MGTPGSGAQRIANSGIEVRCDKSEWHMHHKFVVLDGEKLLTGSFNWTRQVREPRVVGCVGGAWVSSV